MEIGAPTPSTSSPKKAPKKKPYVYIPRRRKKTSNDDQNEDRPKISSKLKERLEEMLKEAEEREEIEDKQDLVDFVKAEEPIEVLVRSPWSFGDYFKNDLYAAVLDEISLEGLDGITLEALWLRLSVLMNMKVTDVQKRIVWDIIRQNAKFEFYELPNPRGKLVLVDRARHMDMVTGHFLDVVADETPEDIYPFAPVPDELASHLDVYGSCLNFDIRTCVSEKIRLLNLAEAERLGNKLVIVADQTLRNESLGLNKTKTLTKLFNNQYSILERIGRSRRSGETSIGKTSLHSLVDSKTIFYLRKVLVEHDLIAKQSVCFKLNKITSHVNAMVFHLKRFFVRYKTKRQIALEQIVELLRKKPNYRMDFAELKMAFEPEIWNYVVTKMIRNGADLKQVINANLYIPYREMYPNATKKEYMGKNRERSLRVVQLLDPNVNLYKENNKEEPQKEESSDDEPMCETTYNKSVYNQIYDVIYESGGHGMTMRQITLKLGVDVYLVRLTMKSLERDNLVYGVYDELGFTRVLKYYATTYQKRNSKNQTSEAMDVQNDDETLDFISKVLEIDKEYLKTPIVEDENPKCEQVDPLKGEYDFLKQFRKKCREDKFNSNFKGEFYKIEKLEEDKNKMEKLLKNEHNFFDMKTSIRNGVIKQVNLGINFPKIEFVNDEPKHEGFDLFGETHKNPMKKITPIDYRNLQTKVEKFLSLSNNKKFFHKPENAISIKILIEYLDVAPNFSMNRLIEKCESIDFQNELDIAEIEDAENSEEFDKFSMIQNCENEEFPNETPRESTLEFKTELLRIFEEDEPKFHSSSDNFHAEIREEIRTEENEIAFVDVLQDSSLQEIDRIEFASKVYDVKVEEYFGEKILVENSGLDKNNVETILLYSKPTIKTEIGQKYCNKTLSQRALNRANYILNVISNDKLVSDIPRVVNNIKKIELEKGLSGTVDKKSINRLVQKLISEGFIIGMKVILRFNKTVRTKNILAVPNLDFHPILNAVIEQMKMSFFAYRKRKHSETEPEDQDVVEVECKYKYSRIIGRCYGHAAKSARQKILHEFLFYLVYCYDGEALEKDEISQSIQDSNPDDHPVYRNEVSWKMFVPPIPNYENYTKGWINYSDALLRMPINIFVKLFNVRYVIPELVQILNDPIKKHYLIKYIPAKIQNACFYRRKHLLSIYNDLQRLCYQGLLQFGEHSIHTKENLFVYLNRKAIVYDTTSSDPGYHQTTEKEYPRLEFVFNAEADVANYWGTVWSICIRTKLGVRYAMLNQTITLQEIYYVPAMIEAAKPVTCEQAIANDVGYIPGDGRGAAGFDSNTWMFRSGNWISSTLLTDSKFDARPTGIRKRQLDKIRTKPAIKQLRDAPKDSAKRKRIATSQHQNQSSSKSNVAPGRGSKTSKPIVRKIIPRPSKAKVTRVDEIDTRIKNSALFARSRFSQREDEMLVLISYAIKYLFPGFKRRLISFAVVRDLMHRLCPRCLKKVSMAYNLRIRKHCHYFTATHNFVDLEADNFVRKHFSKFRETIISGNKKISQEHLHIGLVYLVAYCVDSFEKNAKRNKKILDEVGYIDYLETNFDSIRSSKETKNVLYQDPESKEAILIETVKSIIHSSIGFEIDDTIKLIQKQLTTVYEAYSEDVLRKAMLNLREHNLIKTPTIANRKIVKAKPENSLQSSYMYTYKMITKFRKDVSIQAHSLLKTLRDSEIHKMKKFDTEKYQEGHGLALSELRQEFEIRIGLEIPDTQFILDPAITSHLHLIKELYARYNRLMAKRSTQDAELPQDEQKKDDRVLEDLNELSECIKDGDYNRINNKMSDLAFLLTKGLFPELEDEDERIERFSKHFLTMVPEVSFECDFDGKMEVFDEIDCSDAFEKVKEMIRSDCIITIVELSSDDLDFTPIVSDSQETCFVTNLLKFIENYGVFGATGTELTNYFDQNSPRRSSLTLPTVIDHFSATKVVHRFGVKFFRFVHWTFVDEWTANWDDRRETMIKSKLKPLPWVKVDGEVNERILVDWLFAVMSYCVSNPVAAFTAIAKRFNFLKPVDLYVLLEYLQIFNCLDLKCYTNFKPEADLFSEPHECESRKSHSTDSFDNVYVEMNRLAVLKLSSLSSKGQDLTSPFEEPQK